jgi:hypothetical protein
VSDCDEIVEHHPALFTPAPEPRRSGCTPLVHTFGVLSSPGRAGQSGDMAHSTYIGIKKPDAAGTFEAWLFLLQGVPATQPPRNIWRIMSRSELHDLQREWQVDEVRGDGLIWLK